MAINTTYKADRPYAILMSGRPDEPDTHRSIAVYTHAELVEYRAKGWKPAKEFTEMSSRALRSPKGYW